MEARAMPRLYLHGSHSELANDPSPAAGRHSLANPRKSPRQPAATRLGQPGLCDGQLYPREQDSDLGEPIAAGYFFVPSTCRPGISGRRRPLNELPPEPALDAQVSCRNGLIEWRAGLDDAIVLGMQRQRASDSTVRADCVGRFLPGFVPLPRFAEIMLALEHQGPRRTHPDTVPAVHAGRVRERNVEFRRDSRVKPTAGHGNRERVLRINAAGLDALVAENAFGVVANVQFVVDFGGLLLCRCGIAVIGIPVRISTVAFHVAEQFGGGRDICARGQEFQHHAPTDPATRSESVRIAMPLSAFREHAGTSAREPSSSTTQTRHAFTGARVSR